MIFSLKTLVILVFILLLLHIASLVFLYLLFSRESEYMEQTPNPPQAGKTFRHRINIIKPMMVDDAAAYELEQKQRR